MRSRKLSPGLLVMRTTSQSDSSWVPPVTALRSPPASRITGADSPVIALSLTLAAPTIASPSPGRMSPASTSTRSPARRSAEDDDGHRRIALRRGQFLGEHVLARAAQRIRLRLAATFGQRLGEVGEQQGEPQPQADPEDEAGRRLAVAAPAPAPTAPVVSTLQTNTTNITGLRNCSRGDSLRNASATAA